LPGGVLAGLVQFGAAVIVRGGYDGRTLTSGVLLVTVGAVTGSVATLTVRAEAELAEATAARAAVAERERLARSIHDGVLQVLALVHRRGNEAGGDWALVATEAAEQEAALRRLITSGRDLRPPDVTTSPRRCVRWPASGSPSAHRATRCCWTPAPRRS
jgi:hypothetical protein